MPDGRKQKLQQLGSDALADALLDMAKHNEQIDGIINRMIATPKENVSQYKKKLSGLKRSTKSIDWRQSSGFADKLSLILEDLQASSPDPCTGVELLAAFFETDDSVFSRCDDSNGSIGEVYRFEAKELFVHYATSCADKEKIVILLLRLCRKNDYGVRSSLMDSTSLFLDEPMIRIMIEKLQGMAAEEQEEYSKKSYFSIIKSLAKQIKDGKLFERTILKMHGESSYTILKIAQVYLDCNDVDTASEWMQRYPKNESSQRTEYLQVLTEIYKRQGDTASLTALLEKKFKARPNKHTLKELLDVIGEKYKDAVIDEEVNMLLHDTTLQLSTLSFLLDCEKYDEAETYLFARSDALDGYMYETLLPIGKTLEAQKRFLAASLVYRGLLDSILERAYTKSYPYGIRYLKKLDVYSFLVENWRTFPDHTTYKESLVQKHGKKRSFWGQYNG